MSERSGDPDSSGEDSFKNHKVLFTIHPYGHGMPCPCNAKRTQSQPGPQPKYAKQTQFPAETPIYELRTTNYELLYAKRTQSPYGHGMPCP